MSPIDITRITIQINGEQHVLVDILTDWMNLRERQPIKVEAAALQELGFGPAKEAPGVSSIGVGDHIPRFCFDHHPGTTFVREEDARSLMQDSFQQKAVAQAWQEALEETAKLLASRLVQTSLVSRALPIFYDWGNEYKRDRSGSQPDRNKSKVKNRKAAKAARKARKANR
jgi:hypothetical protein